MPGYRGHLAGATVFYGVTIYLLRSFNPSIATLIEWLACTYAGALFPDIDVKSKGQKFFYWGIVAIVAALLYQKKYMLMIGVSCLAMLPMLVRHRGLFHRLGFLAFFVASIALGLSFCWPAFIKVIWFDAVFFMLGIISHLWFDLGWRKMING